MQEEGGLITQSDLANWKVQIEEPVKTSYKGIEVYKLSQWTQGPAMLQALNILENFDLKSMGYNSARYLNTIYQAMNLAFADRDFYYGDPYFPPAEPLRGLLSKDYAKERAKLLNKERNDPAVGPGDPYPFQGEVNPYRALLEKWNTKPAAPPASTPPANQDSVRPPVQAFAHSSADDDYKRAFYAGTTSVEAADEEGWVVSVTPSGGWVPAVIAGHTGVGLSQRAQSFVTDRTESPFNVIEPGKHPRVTLTPTLAFQNGKPFLCFSVQGGDSQELVFVTSDAQLLRFSAAQVRPQGPGAGGMAGINLGAKSTVIFFGSVDPAADVVVATVSSSTATIAGADPGRAKVSALSEFPAKGRATGGVRAHSFLKGEDVLGLAWAGPAPALAVGADGSQRTLPEAGAKRDASGAPLDNVIGSIGFSL